MKKSVLQGAVFFLGCVFYACSGSQPPPDAMQQIVTSFAPLECQAFRLREARFALANEIRFTEDTLRQAAARYDTAQLHGKLHKLYLQKEEMAAQSKHLADSIKQTLDSLMLHHLTEKKEREQFNDLLHSELRKMGCTDAE